MVIFHHGSSSAFPIMSSLTGLYHHRTPVLSSTARDRNNDAAQLTDVSADLLRAPVVSVVEHQLTEAQSETHPSAVDEALCIKEIDATRVVLGAKSSQLGSGQRPHGMLIVDRAANLHVRASHEVKVRRYVNDDEELLSSCNLDLRFAVDNVLLVEGVRVSVVVESKVCHADTDSASVDHVDVVVEVCDMAGSVDGGVGGGGGVGGDGYGCGGG
jgi:hypothetical protein